MADAEGLVFVTVGTTSFDKLIETVTSPLICKILKSHGYKNLLLQIGRGNFEPEVESLNGLNIEFYRFKESIKDDINRASLVISHAGAGSILESLQAGRHLVVVVNHELMDNHQLELAQQLAQHSHSFYGDCNNLQQVLEDLDITRLRPFPPGKPKTFGSYLNSVMGISNQSAME